MTEDAQRELEQRALRNVRGLVDRMDAEEMLSRRKQLRLVGALIVGIGVLVIGMLVVNASGPKPEPFDLKTVKAPEARPQGSRRP